MGGFRERVERELRGQILPFWLKYAVDDEFGNCADRLRMT